MNRSLSISLFLIMICLVMVACGGNNEESEAIAENSGEEPADTEESAEETDEVKT